MQNENGDTALHSALKSSFSPAEKTSILLDYGASVALNIKNKEGITPLAIAEKDLALYRKLVADEKHSDGTAIKEEEIKDYRERIKTYEQLVRKMESYGPQSRALPHGLPDHEKTRVAAAADALRNSVAGMQPDTSSVPFKPKTPDRDPHSIA